MTSCLGKAEWIIDSGATCLMCNEPSTFVNNEKLKIKLGDGYEIDGIGSGTVVITTQLSIGKSKKRTLHIYVLHIPSLSYNLLSVSAATGQDKTVKFEGNVSQILNGNKLVAFGIGIQSRELFVFELQ